jgi:hypothetical protein
VRLAPRRAGVLILKQRSGCELTAILALAPVISAPLGAVIGGIALSPIKVPSPIARCSVVGHLLAASGAGSDILLDNHVAIQALGIDHYATPVCFSDGP